MGRMSFLPELTEFLREHGSIYTVRSYEAPTAIVRVDGVGQCKRRFVRQVYHKDDLESFVEQSGFEGVDSWWRKIKSFIPLDRSQYLYVVLVL